MFPGVPTPRYGGQAVPPRPAEIEAVLMWVGPRRRNEHADPAAFVPHLCALFEDFTAPVLQRIGKH